MTPAVPRASEPETSPGKDERRPGGGLVARLKASLAARLPALEIPIPGPTGPFLVGLTQQTLAMEADEAPRVLTLDIWYPASGTEGHARAPYTEKALNEALSKQFRMPRFMFPETPSYAYHEAPPAPGPHAVVIFNHGYAAFSKQNVSTFQELASHGYIVISLAHPGESLMARDAQGQAVLFDARSEVNREVQRLQKDLNSYAKRLAERLSRQRKAETPEAYAHASAELAGDPQFAALRPQIRRWVQDTRAVIAALRGAQCSGVLREADPGKLTVMGHSLGGVVAMHLAVEPMEGLRGIVNLDGPWLQEDPEAIARPCVPSLNLLSTHYQVAKQDLSTCGTLDGLYRESTAGAHLIDMKGAAHYNFTDLNFTPALKATFMLGPIDNRLMGELQNQAIREFLRRTTRDGGVFESPLVPAHAAVEQVVFPGKREG